MRTNPNVELVEIVETVIKNNPTLRFNQILHGLGIVKSDVSTFYDNPEEVLERAKESELYQKSTERGSFKGVY